MTLSDRAVARLRERLVTPELPERYEPIEEIGRGGMGVVWRVRDRLLERDVAVKLLADHIGGPDFTARLRREARILARLEHPGIVAVYDVGELADGRAWYVMRLIRGERLDQAAAQLATRGEALRVMERLAETLAFAHAAGVLHRDLTPRNVMLGPFGEVLVLDWGLARDDSVVEPARANADSKRAADIVTGHGAVLGTPGFMAPEQAAGLSADPRSDIYGLGAILRELLSARAEPVPKPLAAIRDRALADDPAKRYPDAIAFRDDLRRFQDGAPVMAYKEGPLDAVARIYRLYRTPILLLAAYAIMRVLILLWPGI